MEQRRPLSVYEKRQRQRERQRKQRMRFFAFSFVVILLLSGVITALISLPGWIRASKTHASEAASAVQTEEGGAPAEGTEGAQTVTGSIGPVQQADAGGYTTLSAAQLALPENGRVDMAYFDDALFIGDSLTQGFQVYASGIANAHYASYVGVGPKQLISGTVTNLEGNVVTAIDEILAASPKKVYILLGTNSLSSQDDEALLKYYGDFLDFLAPQLPADTVYYLQGIPPVTAEKAAGDASYAQERIQALDESIAQMAYARGWHYLNLYGALADEAGVLRGDYVEGSDGVHLNGTGYGAWKEFLITHTAYSADSPYIAGSPYLLS